MGKTDVGVSDKWTKIHLVVCRNTKKKVRKNTKHVNIELGALRMEKMKEMYK